MKKKVTVEVEEGGGGGCKAVVGAYAIAGIGGGKGWRGALWVQWRERSRWCERQPTDQEEEEAGIQASEGAWRGKSSRKGRPTGEEVDEKGSEKIGSRSGRKINNNR